MYAGRMVESGSVSDIFDDPQHPYTLGLMSSLPSLGARQERLVTIPGTVPSANAMPSGCRFASRCPFAAPECASKPPLSELRPGHALACWRAPIEALGTSPKLASA
jgi:oligopeptide/dipeptide ABC transporter ATP-binding protein